jgi:hypothetical protein
MKGIIITTSEATKNFLGDCLKSCYGPKYPIVVVGNGGYLPDVTRWNTAVIKNDWNGFELGGIARGAEMFDEFIHLMDTCIVKDIKMFDQMFEAPGGVHLCPRFFSYLGKYRTDALKQIGIPRIETKQEAVAMEVSWNAQYLAADSQAKQFEPVLPIETDVFEEKYGRKNMVCENDFIKKYKGTYR